MEWLRGITDVCWLGPTCRLNWESLSAIAAASLGLLAWLNGRKATKIAEEATRIAEAQRDEIVLAREASGRVIARLIVMEVGVAPVRAIELLNATDQSMPDLARLDLPNGEHFRRSLDDALEDFMPGATAMVDRLHTLPVAIGNDLAIVMAYCRGLNISAQKIRARLKPLTTRGDWVYEGAATDLEDLMTGCRSVALSGIALANQVRAYIGVPPVDYADPALGLDLSRLSDT